MHLAGINTLAYSACFGNNLGMLQECVRQGFDVNFDFLSKTPLSIACFKGYFEMIKYLVENGTHVNIEYAEMSSPLMEACRHGNLEIVKYLIENGARVNDPVTRYSWPLRGALDSQGDSFGIVSYLVQNGIDIHAAWNQRTLLHGTHKYHDPKAIQLLINLGVNVNARDPDGNTPLYEAVLAGQDWIIRILVENGAYIHDYYHLENAFLLDLIHINYNYNDERGHSLIRFLIRRGARLAVKSTPVSMVNKARMRAYLCMRVDAIDVIRFIHEFL